MSEAISTPAIGVIFHPTFPPETLASYARRAEAAGFDELWLWDDCFLPGALTSAAIALSATRTLSVGIGLLPATAHNALFTAMEITTLACAFPGRFLPGFGHGVPHWMTQIGAAPQSSLKALAETVTAVRQLLQGEPVTAYGEHIRFDRVQMQRTAKEAPPLYIGAMREKTLQLAGRIGDGTILTGMSSPDYIRWAWKHIRSGMAAAGKNQHRVTVYVDVKVSDNAMGARAAARCALAARLPWADVQLNALGIAADVTKFIEKYGCDGIAQQMPDDWLDAFCAAGTAQQVADAIQRYAAAGADAIIFQPLNGDSVCLDEYTRYLMPDLKPTR